MPSQDYKANNDTFDIGGIKKAHSRYADGAGKAPEKFFPQTGKIPRHLALSEKGKEKYGKKMQRDLSRLQKNAPKMAAGLAKGKTGAIATFAGGLFGQIDWSVDWLFLLLASFAFLKDIFDIAFAITGTWLTALLSLAPITGGFFSSTATVIGMTISFAGDLMFLILTVTVLLYIGSSLKNRGMAKYFIGMAMEFIAEALPGISWLPWTVIYVFILYFCVLYDRMLNKSESKQASA
jgi:hypothetical protein